MDDKPTEKFAPPLADVDLSGPDARYPHIPCNWRSAMTGYIPLCAFLAGIDIAFIPLILPSISPNVQTPFTGLSLDFSYIAILLFGLSAAMLVGAAELFLHAAEFNVSALSPDYKEFLNKNIDFVKTQNDSLKNNYNRAAILYNIGIIFIFGGLFLALWPYNFGIATAVAAVGVIVEIMQWNRKRTTPQSQEKYKLNK